MYSNAWESAYEKLFLVHDRSDLNPHSSRETAVKFDQTKTIFVAYQELYKWKA